jgi:hypothetical protein
MRSARANDAAALALALPTGQRLQKTQIDDAIFSREFHFGFVKRGRVRY